MPDEVDAITGLPIYSLYGERRRPSREQLAGLDALVFDVQDIGARFYTYVSTMGMAMEAAAEAGIRFVVLDRVNPIGGEAVEGPLLEGPTDFIGWHRLPVRHGKTVGELAELFRRERGIDVELTVVPVKGWKREQWQDEAGLPWVDTSPNIRSLAAAGLYPGLGLLERAVSVGRGTPTPFEIVGAPYVDGARLSARARPAARRRRHADPLHADGEHARQRGVRRLAAHHHRSPRAALGRGRPAHRRRARAALSRPVPRRCHAAAATAPRDARAGPRRPMAAELSPSEATEPLDNLDKHLGYSRP